VVGVACVNPHLHFKHSAIKPFNKKSFTIPPTLEIKIYKPKPPNIRLVITKPQAKHNINQIFSKS
jgi:hypothetical protein